MADENTVLLSVSAYNFIKNENFKHNLFLDNLLSKAHLSVDHQSLEFNSKDIDEALRFCYFERYKKKLATMKTQFARYGDKEEK